MISQSTFWPRFKKPCRYMSLQFTSFTQRPTDTYTAYLRQLTPIKQSTNNMNHIYVLKKKLQINRHMSKKVIKVPTKELIT